MTRTGELVQCSEAVGRPLPPITPISTVLSNSRITSTAHSRHYNSSSNCYRSSLSPTHHHFTPARTPQLQCHTPRTRLTSAIGGGQHRSSSSSRHHAVRSRYRTCSFQVMRRRHRKPRGIPLRACCSQTRAGVHRRPLPGRCGLTRSSSRCGRSNHPAPKSASRTTNHLQQYVHV